MSEEEVNNEKSNYEEKKKTRRTRKDQDGRDFQCPCGKSYLSYPALYTHIKTKHQGKTPREDGILIAKVEFEDENEHKDPLLSIQQNISRYFPGNQPENYPTALSIQNQQKITAFITNWDSIKDINLLDSINRNPLTTIEQIFGHFLSEMKEKVEAEGFMYISQFILSFYEGIISEKSDPNYCKENNGSQLPNFFNDLIFHSKFPSNEETKRGSPLNNMTFACKILYFFGVWIFEQRYTNLSAKFHLN